MSIARHAGNARAPRIVSPETMYDAICEYGIIPFFENPVRGYSVEELTPPQFWFDGDDEAGLGPWDWKIYCVQSGEVAYGKFLGGKAAFATVPFYRHLMNWRRSLPRYAVPPGPQTEVLEYVLRNGSATIREIRQLLGVKKNVADMLVARLQMATRLVTGDIARVYRGPDLHYNGWQTASFCTPDALFSLDGGSRGSEASAPALSRFPGFPFADEAAEVLPAPEESRALLLEHLRFLNPDAPEDRLIKLLT